MKTGLASLLREPLAANRPDLDDPSTTDRLHRAILARKPFLRKIYAEHYRRLRASLPESARRPVVVELGSGGGFLKEVIPDALTSDVLPVSGLDLRMSGTSLPLKTASVDVFFLLDTFHHIPDAAAFLAEASRCLRPGGAIFMMEPANTWWGRLIFRNFHHEPFRPELGWEFPSSGPLSSANGALPWIVFRRDRARFQREFARLELRRLQAQMPFRYLLSGGFSLRQLAPSAAFLPATWLELLLRPFHPWLGMFYWIEIRKTEEPDAASGRT